MFAVVGVGLGLSGYISINAVKQFFMNAETGEVGPLAQTFVALVALQTTFVVFLLGSIVSTVTGSRIAAEASSTKEAMIANGAASFVGFYVMVGLALVIMFTAVGSGDASGGGGGGGGNVDLGRFVSPILQVGIPTGLVGVAAGGILQKLD
ncbi:hypothetical protein C462_05318 [Halorubrum distributum JCM 13916]|uniref:Uncharacterized protein n=1 Tax=Halorubrum distributum JCM 13916 TaxID=1230455 RepID=M0PS97_9EURY|nr:hypothetical protein C462_05318 [Halorubrum arcis JCM 13916]